MNGPPPQDPERPGARRDLRIAVLVVVLLAVVSAVRAAGSSDVGGDFLRYHRAGRLVAEGDADRLYDIQKMPPPKSDAESRAAWRELNRLEFKYDPSFAVYMAPWGALEPRAAWILWGAWNGLMIGLTFAAARSLCGLPWRWAWLPFLALLHKANSNLNLGQINPTAIAAATGALWIAARGDSVWSGIAAAFGTSIKYLPSLATASFAARRQWKSVIAFVAALPLFFWGLPALVLGPARATSLFLEHKELRASAYTGAAPDDLPGHSIKSFLYRVLGTTRYQTGSEEKRIDMSVSVAELPPEVLKWTVLGLSAAVIAVVVRETVRSLRGPQTPIVLGLQAGLLLCAVPIVSPEARAPHFLYLAVPLFAVAEGLRRAFAEGWQGRRAALAAAVLGVVLLQTDSKSIVGAAAHTFDAYCALGWGALAIFVAQILLLRRASAR